MQSHKNALTTGLRFSTPVA